MAKLTTPQAARLINRGDRTVRQWKQRGHAPKELTTEDLVRLRELASYAPTPKRHLKLEVDRERDPASSETEE